MSSETQDSSRMASLHKGLALFSRIVSDRGTTQLAELARDLSLPRSTLYRLIDALQERGLITRIGRGRYDVGFSFAERLSGLSIIDQIARVSRPILRKLARECGSTAHLGVLEGDMVTYVVKESLGVAPSARVFTQETAQLEAYCSGIGKVLLAWMPESERDRYLANGPFVALTEQTITDPLILRRSLEKVRADGFAKDNGEISPDLSCLAIPLWPGRHRRPMNAAISLSFNRASGQPFEDALCLGKLSACAAEISVKLGIRADDGNVIE